ncbi:hypothetical protein JCM10908_004820 [Rhodotorula pacifica]|uniref:aminotransferase-like domain-containing protein n=1 Tax=Rhodotorula pacifica TaxID=1495444 RepID=UPI0031741DE6
MDDAFTMQSSGTAPSSHAALDKPESIDLSHHLSELAKARISSPLKGLYKYFTQPGMLSLAGGLPPPEAFPYESITAQTLARNSFKTTEQGFGAWLWSLVGGGGKKTDQWTIPKWDEDKSRVQLSTALQYGTAAGLPPLAQFIYDFTLRVYRPATSDFKTVINAGSTDAWGKIVTSLCNPGDGVLAEEWTYPSALATAWPNGIKPVPLPMDGDGLTVDGMEQVLANWNPDEHEGMQRPRVLYTVPVCQNPTGGTVSLERKRAIYALAVKYDVIIVEDDPYYFLQSGEYHRSQDARSAALSNKTESDAEFLASLVPSYLNLDYQGRVVRIDTFSKTICPGSRLGWTTCNPLFAERLERANESSTQAASGMSQALVGALLAEQWGYTGYLRWLKGLKAEYRNRRDTLVDNLLDVSHASLEARQSRDGAYEVWFARGDLSEKVPDRAKLLSFVAPVGGMFVWLRVHFATHPRYHSTPTTELLMSLWEDLAEHHVLIVPGTIFSAASVGQDLVITPSGDGFFRLSFSSATPDEMKRACRILAERVARFFG